MSFEPYETSVEEGQPIELYTFVMGATTYRYTSNEVDVVHGTLGTFTAIPISRGSIEANKAKDGDKIEIKIPASYPVAQNFVNSIPGKPILMALRRMHRPDPAEQTVVFFNGIVRQARFEANRTVAILLVNSLMSAENRQVPRLTFQGLCNHMLYDARCQIDENDPAWKHTLPVSAVSGRQLTVDGAGAVASGAGLPDFFEGGFIAFDSDYRLILTQSGDLLTLQTPFALSPLGQNVIVNAGCKHRIIQDCRDKFNNVDNYGGFPYVPLKNPFTTGI